MNKVGYRCAQPTWLTTKKNRRIFQYGGSNFVKLKDLISL